MLSTSLNLLPNVANDPANLPAGQGDSKGRHVTVTSQLMRDDSSPEDFGNGRSRSSFPRNRAALGTGVLDVKRLAILRAVARAGSFAAAAEALSYTPSAVSQQMCALERGTGVILFRRGARGVQLTHAGRVLLSHAEAMLARLADAQAELEAMGGRGDGRLRFGSFSSATGVFAARAFETFRARSPAWQLSFADGEPYESVSHLLRGQLDLAVIFDLEHWPATTDYDGAVICADDELERIPLLDDPYLLVLPGDHRLAADETITIDRLSDEPVLVGSPWHRDFEAVCGRAGVRPRLDFSCRGTGFEALQAFVSAGRGMTLMPRLALGWLRADLVARPLDHAPVRRVQAAMLASGQRSLGISAMLQILVELTARLAYPGPGEHAAPAAADGSRA